ncbi:MAG: hypothetical protein IPH31_14745 [Lewinellaceae bacterium]|nr:hypothetical protein [Lewinellaceae bacterium]
MTQDARYDSIIWAGTRSGLIRVNKVTKSLEYFRYGHPDALLEEQSNAMICLLSCPDGRLFIGTWNGGLLEFNPATQQFQQFFIGHGDVILDKQSKKFCLVDDGLDAIWVGSEMGICRFDIKNQPCRW